MNYINYINEVVKPQENKSTGFKMDSNILRNNMVPDIKSIEIIKTAFITKRDLIITHKFENLPSYEKRLHLDVSFDIRGMCIDLGPIRIWDYSFWE